MTIQAEALQQALTEISANVYNWERDAIRSVADKALATVSDASPPVSVQPVSSDAQEHAGYFKRSSEFGPWVEVEPGTDGAVRLYAAPAITERQLAELDELGAEVARLQKALAFWLPSVTDREDEVACRILEDAFLLVGCDFDEKSAQELGWIQFAPPSPVSAQPSDETPIDREFLAQNLTVLAARPGTSINAFGEEWAAGLAKDALDLLSQYDDVLRGLALWLSAGGYNSDGLIDPKTADDNIRWGVNYLLEVERKRTTQPAQPISSEAQPAKRSYCPEHWFHPCSCALASPSPDVRPSVPVKKEPVAAQPQEHAMTDNERRAFERFDKPEWAACSNMCLRVILSVCHETITRCGAKIENLQDALAAAQAAPAVPEGALPAFIAYVKRLYTGNPKDHPDWAAFEAGFNAAAAPAVQAAPQEQSYLHWCQTLIKALKRLSFTAQTTGGTAGQDAELQAAIAEAERAMSLGACAAAIDKAEADYLALDCIEYDPTGQLVSADVIVGGERVKMVREDN